MTEAASALKMPTAYPPGYEKARLIDPRVADQYIEHTMIGDPLGERMAEDLEQFSREQSTRWIDAAMNQEGEEALRGAPDSLRELFAEAETRPDWMGADNSSLAPGIEMFHRNSKVFLLAFVTGVLLEGFTTNIAKSFHITGRVRDQGLRRLENNNRHMMDIFFPGGLERDGDGWKLSVRIRIVHSRMRRLLSNSEDWDTEAWGTPISMAHLGYALAAFSARLLKHGKTLGAVYTDEEYASFMQVWRYAGHLMAIPETILFRDAKEALNLYDVGFVCEPRSEMESIVMANSLVNSSPLVAGISEPKERAKTADIVYRLSRDLMGDELADSLNFPPMHSFGVVSLVRTKERVGQLLEKVIPGRARHNQFDRFANLLESSLYDDAGISYRLPDHVYSEESSHW